MQIQVWDYQTAYLEGSLPCKSKMDEYGKDVLQVYMYAATDMTWLHTSVLLRKNVRTQKVQSPLYACTV